MMEAGVWLLGISGTACGGVSPPLFNFLLCIAWFTPTTLLRHDHRLYLLEGIELGLKFMFVDFLTVSWHSREVSSTELTFRPAGCS
jgi:hypothetical protein